MTIGMLLNAPYPGDVRVKKETHALLQAGFRVCLLCLRRPGEKYAETVDGIAVQRLDGGTNDVTLALWDAIMAFTFVHPLFRKAVPQWVAQNGVDALHVHDLPLVGTALALRPSLGKPVVADFHENYPDALRTWFTWRKNPLVRLKNFIFMNPDRWVKWEQRAVLESDRVIAVVDEMKQRLVDTYHADPASITVVSNTEERSFLQQPSHPDIYRQLDGKFILTYSGNIGPHRGVDTVIEAMAHLKSNTAIVFAIIGSGSEAVMNRLKTLAENLGVANAVVFFGRQPFEKFYSYMRFTDVNVIPHKSNSHTDNTIPHKLFQAMMVGKPVLVSSSAPLKRVINATGAGVIFNADDPKDLAEKISLLYNDQALQQRCGKNGVQATLEGAWNWEHEQEQLIGLYTHLDHQRKAAT